jgi:hypothetical protein
VCAQRSTRCAWTRRWHRVVTFSANTLAKRGDQSDGKRILWPKPEADKDYTVSIETGTSATSVEPSVNREFGRFEDLASKLAAVPKTELGEKREES